MYKLLHPLKMVNHLFPSNHSLKIEILSSPHPFENLVVGSTQALKKYKMPEEECLNLTSASISVKAGDSKCELLGNHHVHEEKR